MPSLAEQFLGTVRYQIPPSVHKQLWSKLHINPDLTPSQLIHGARHNIVPRRIRASLLTLRRRHPHEKMVSNHNHTDVVGDDGVASPELFVIKLEAILKILKSF